MIASWAKLIGRIQVAFTTRKLPKLDLTNVSGTTLLDQGGIDHVVQLKMPNGKLTHRIGVDYTNTMVTK